MNEWSSLAPVDLSDEPEFSCYWLILLHANITNNLV